MSASGNLRTGKPVSSPAARAAVMSAAACSSAAFGTLYSRTNLRVTLAVMQARTGSTGSAASAAYVTIVARCLITARSSPRLAPSATSMTRSTGPNALTCSAASGER